MGQLIQQYLAEAVFSFSIVLCFVLLVQFILFKARPPFERAALSTLCGAVVYLLFLLAGGAGPAELVQQLVLPALVVFALFYALFRRAWSQEDAAE